jgi:iron only hydrogenase large subunit-like protein
MANYYHAFKVVTEKCRGHMTCMRRCPTQAIRVRNGKAVINEELCVDCGNCISVCPSGAIVPIVDMIAEFANFKYKVVVPSPVLYSQFDSRIHPFIIHLAFKKLGFNLVVDETHSNASLEKALQRQVEQHKGRFPLISSDCPAVIRLIQVKYPDLVELIAPIDVPREVTARDVRKKLPEKLGLKPADIGIFYIAPCPAKIVSIKQPAEKVLSWFDGGFSIQDVYPLLLPQVKTVMQDFDESQVPQDFQFNTGWATLGSIIRSAGMENWLSVSGVDHVMKIFDDIENSRLRNIEFVEAFSCMLGCIGGTFNVENPYIVRTNSKKQRDRYDERRKLIDEDFEEKYEQGNYFMDSPILPRPTTYFDTDLQTSIKRMKERERIYHKLPQIDCGVCGSPTCMAFAEDCVHEEAKVTDCFFFSIPDRRELIVP